MPAPKQPLVFIVSGPSGSGKSTLVQKLLELPGTMLSVSCTTRKPRPTENAGKWYNFVTEAEFQQMVERGEFLESAQVFGKSWYGTPRKWLDEARHKGLDLVLEIDVQGAAQVKQKLPGAVAIFILPPSRQELERRLRERGQDSEEEIARRLEQARKEILAFRELMAGAPPMLDHPRSHKPTRVAIEELNAGILEYQLPNDPAGEDEKEGK